jgi:stage V sporulation protein R
VPKLNKYINTTPVLNGDNRIPGVKLPKALQDLLPQIFQAVRDFGCDFYPTVVEKLKHDEISEIAAYGGFPCRYPHWRWGMEFAELQMGYEFGMHKIYEMVVNTNPCYIYNLESNTLLDDVTVVAHALGHNDFFKNNIFFSQTSQNMMNELANHGTRIRRYMARWGKERVTAFLDQILRIETLIDPAKAWERKQIDDPFVRDHREYDFPSRLTVPEGHDYMEPYLNPKEWTRKQQKAIHRAEIAKEIGIYTEKTKDIFGFIRDNAPLKPWQADIADMLYEEAMYFAPQRMTKVLNEGWASFIDFNIIAAQGMASLGQKTNDAGIVEYALHKAGVLGGKYSMNPYKLGFDLFRDIEDRWNKGKFGVEWEECNNAEEKLNWDKDLKLGRKKVFEVRKYYNDVTALIEYFTPEFCEENEYFDWKLYPDGSYKIESRDHKKIKKKIINRYMNGGLPQINLVDANFKGRGYLMLEHNWSDKILHEPYTKGVLNALSFLWGNEVYLTTKDQHEQELIYWCQAGSADVEDDKNVVTVKREDFPR